MNRLVAMAALLVMCATAQAATAEDALRVRAMANPAIAYAGQQVMVQWFLDSPSQVVSFDIIDEPRLGRMAMPLPRAHCRHADHGWTCSVRRYVFFAEAAGTIAIPPVKVRVKLYSEQPAPSEYATFDRTSEAILIRVMPLPAGATAGAVGFVGLHCTGMKTMNGAIVFEANVDGTASFFDTVAPKPASPVDYAYEITPATGVVTTLSDGPIYRTRKWNIRISGEGDERIVTVPDLVVTSFDPKTATMQEARCKGREVALPRQVKK